MNQRCGTCGMFARLTAGVCSSCGTAKLKTVARTRAWRSSRDTDRIVRRGSLRPSKWRLATVVVVLIGSLLSIGAISLQSSSARADMQNATEASCVKMRSAGLQHGDCPTDTAW